MAVEGSLLNGGGRSRFDTRAILALVSIIGAFVYQGALLFVAADTIGSADAQMPQIPAWMSAITMGVIGFYFGAKASTNGNGNGHK